MKLLVVASLLLTCSGSALVRRVDTQACANLQAASNNGDRKIGIAIDSSGSMAGNDPYGLRRAAGRTINDWLVSDSEASGGRQADLVTIIDFDDTAKVLYPLGDPGNADAVFSRIDSDGGTWIADGVRKATSQLTAAGHDPTAKRSGIVVLTDGEDSFPGALVQAINNATGSGIRLSFGFLYSSSDPAAGIQAQPTAVLAAILKSGGAFASIADSQSQHQFVNLVLAHGLTENDNPNPDRSILIGGLATADFVDSSGTNTLNYLAKSGEHLIFTIVSLGAGTITAKLQDSGGQSLGQDTASLSRNGIISLTSKGDGNLKLTLTSTSKTDTSMFAVGVESSLKISNCTLDDPGKKSSGLSTGGKAGLGIGIPALAGLLGLGGFFAYKYWGHKIPFLNKPAPGHAQPQMAEPGHGGDQGPFKHEPMISQQPTAPGQTPGAPPGHPGADPSQMANFNQPGDPSHMNVMQPDPSSMNQQMMPQDPSSQMYQMGNQHMMPQDPSSQLQQMGNQHMMPQDPSSQLQQPMQGPGQGGLGQTGLGSTGMEQGPGYGSTGMEGQHGFGQSGIEQQGLNNTGMEGQQGLGQSGMEQQGLNKTGLEGQPFQNQPNIPQDPSGLGQHAPPQNPGFGQYGPQDPGFGQHIPPQQGPPGGGQMGPQPPFSPSPPPSFPVPPPQPPLSLFPIVGGARRRSSSEERRVTSPVSAISSLTTQAPGPGPQMPLQASPFVPGPPTSAGAVRVELHSAEVVEISSTNVTAEMPDQQQQFRAEMVSPHGVQEMPSQRHQHYAEMPVPEQGSGAQFQGQQ